ncbi:hypothetical protein PoB_006654800 [Plakobranchus ocellatus]|uniref:Uncharacterized protein n=1 Tax=Plakobranchus ocellatus TaxID=259542 RepID=A0AAV4D7L0_9GAST|nr:hypothetical protein PoB_006654800 [Plakobranchus ocellatus]
MTTGEGVEDLTYRLNKPQPAPSGKNMRKKKINHPHSRKILEEQDSKNTSPAGSPRRADINIRPKQKRVLTMPEMYVPIVTLKTRRISLLPLHQSVFQQSYFKRNISNETKTQCILERQVQKNTEMFTLLISER